MQKNSQKQYINSLPAFKRLVRTRNRWRFFLASMTLLCHAFFIGGITLYRDLFNTPVVDGGTITIGIASTVLVLVLFIVFELVYIIVGEKKLDALQVDALEAVEQNG